jgi:hypothetical protein
MGISNNIYDGAGHRIEMAPIKMELALNQSYL